MTARPGQPTSKRQRGVAAVEMAVLLPVLIIFLTIPIFFGRYFWHYTVAHKAAHSAARYLSTISVQEMRTRSMAQAAESVAQGIAVEMLADLNPGGIDAPTIAVFCGTNRRCTGYGASTMPETVVVVVELDMFDNIFGVVNTGRFGKRIGAVAEVSYVGQ